MRIVLVVYTAKKFHDWRDAKEIIGISEEAHACYYYGFEVIILYFCSIKGRKYS
jgi:hypothetical protein